MRVVAICTLVFDRFMNKSSLVIEGLLLFMTNQAEICTGPSEPVRRICSYFSMTDHADTGGHWGVDVLYLLRLGMALLRDA